MKINNPLAETKFYGSDLKDLRDMVRNAGGFLYILILNKSGNENIKRKGMV